MLDIFAGSNTTGEVAEAEGRFWLAFEERAEYVAASSFRFLDRLNGKADVERLFSDVMEGRTVDLRERDVQRRLLP